MAEELLGKMEKVVSYVVSHEVTNQRGKLEPPTGAAELARVCEGDYVLNRDGWVSCRLVALSNRVTPTTG